MAGISLTLEGSNIQLSFQKGDQTTAVLMDARTAQRLFRALGEMLTVITDEDGRGEYGGRAEWFAGGNGDYRPDERYGDDYGAPRRGAFGASESYGNLRRERDERDDYRGDFRGRERDSAGYGGGGSARDWREVE